VKKNLTLLFLLSILFSVAQEKTKIIDKKLPYIQFEELEYNFGNIEYAGEGVHRFYFYNKGKGPLLIKNVRKS